MMDAHLPAMLVALLFGVAVLAMEKIISRSNAKEPIIPVSVEFLFARLCTNEGFCCRTDKFSHVESFENIQRGLRMLKKSAMKNITFSGDPLVYPNLLYRVIKFCREDLGLDSISLVADASKLTEGFMECAARHIDTIIVPCDSFDKQRNNVIGRGTGSDFAQIQEVARLCKKYDVGFEIHTVLNRYNVHEDMNKQIQALQPVQWKVFRVLATDNGSDETIHNSRRFKVSAMEFRMFCNWHSHQKCLVDRPYYTMGDSHFVLDDHMRFVNQKTGAPTKSILDIDVEEALRDAYWDEGDSYERGGIYDWSEEYVCEECECKTMDL